ncbi:MAG: hypothetical protein AAGK98_00360 [Pseudomonadota bacterium]
MTEFTLTLATKTLTVVRAISQIMEVPDPNEVARAIAAAEATAAGVANPLDGFAGGAGAFDLFGEGPAAEMLAGLGLGGMGAEMLTDMLDFGKPGETGPPTDGSGFGGKHGHYMDDIWGPMDAHGEPIPDNDGSPVAGTTNVYEFEDTEVTVVTWTMTDGEKTWDVYYVMIPEGKEDEADQAINEPGSVVKPNDPDATPEGGEQKPKQKPEDQPEDKPEEKPKEDSEGSGEPKDETKKKGSDDQLPEHGDEAGGPVPQNLGEKDKPGYGLTQPDPDDHSGDDPEFEDEGLDPWIIPDENKNGAVVLEIRGPGYGLTQPASGDEPVGTTPDLPPTDGGETFIAATGFQNLEADNLSFVDHGDLSTEMPDGSFEGNFLTL